MSLEEVVHAGHKVLMEVDYNFLLIAGDPQGILDQLPKPCPILLLNIIIIGIIKFILFY